MMSAQTINDLETGDEIHFTNGDVWSCTPITCGGVVDKGIYLVRGSFKDVRAGRLSGLSYDEMPCTQSLAPIIADALSGGARIVKGVGLTKRAKREKRGADPKDVSR